MNAGLGLDSIILVHEMVTASDGVGCHVHGNRTDRALQRIARDITGGQVSVDAMTRFLAALRENPDRQHGVQEAVEYFVDAVRNPKVTNARWESSRDWAEEYITYIRKADSWLAWREISLRVPSALRETVLPASESCWRGLVDAASCSGVPVPDLAPYVRAVFRADHYDTFDQAQWQEAWRDLALLHLDHGPTRAALLIRAGITRAEAQTADLDDESLAMMAALRSPAPSARA